MSPNWDSPGGVSVRVRDMRTKVVGDDVPLVAEVEVSALDSTEDDRSEPHYTFQVGDTEFEVVPGTTGMSVRRLALTGALQVERAESGGWVNWGRVKLVGNENLKISIPLSARVQTAKEES